MIYQGDIYWADLNPTIGSEQLGLRPVLVLQNNTLNEKMNTVVIAPLTTNTKAKGKLTTFFLSAEDSYLPKDSVTLLFQIRTIDKKRLREKQGSLTSEDFQEVLRQLWHVF